MNTKIAIIMPCYYPSNRMIEAFESLKSQTKRNHIVLYMINDCSPNTDCDYQDIRNKYSCYFKIIYLKNKKNSGTGIARQTGLDHIKEDYLIFHDDDDYLYNQYVIENYLNIIKQNPDVAIAFGDIISAWNGIIDPAARKNKNLFRGQLISKKFIDKYNLKFDEAVSYMGEDYVFFHKLKYYLDISKAKIIYTNQIVYIDNNYEDFITLTAGLIPENYSNNHSNNNKKLTKIVFDKIRIYYELIIFFQAHSNNLQKRHIHIIYAILKTVMNLCCVMIRILEKYGIKKDYSLKEIQELYNKWYFLLTLVKKNQNIIEKWIYDFDDPKEYQDLLQLNQKISFDEFYNNFQDRFNQLRN